MDASQKLSQRIFHEFFPPPRFLEMPAVGLDISDAAVTALELVRRKGSYAVGRFGRRPLPTGVISGGYVNDKERVVGELKKLKDELHLDFVNASLSEEKAYLYKTEIPPVSQKEMRSAILFTLEENVPISPAEAIFDYTITHAAMGTSDAALEVSVTVLPRTVTQTYTALLLAAGLTPLSFEIEAQAICRAVIPRGDRATHLVAHFGEEKTGLFIVSDEVVHFTATVAIGGAAIAEALLEHPVSWNPLPRGEAYAKGAVVRHGGAARSSLPADPVGALHAEVGKLITYWQTHAGGALGAESAVGKIVLCGSAAALEGFTGSLSRSLALPVETANVWRNVFSFDAYIPPILYEESLEYAAAVGLALPKDH